MLCAQEEMEMANSQGKKEEITLAVIFVIIVGIVVKVAIAVRWESACVMMWHLI
jgi:flagellar basal body-associated protein FliL